VQTSRTVTRRHFLPCEREALARRIADPRDVSIAIQEALNGKMVDWMERASDAEYEAAVAKAECGWTSVDVDVRAFSQLW